jgi:hypothetical protein
MTVVRSPASAPAVEMQPDPVQAVFLGPVEQEDLSFFVARYRQAEAVAQRAAALRDEALEALLRAQRLAVNGRDDLVVNLDTFEIAPKKMAEVPEAV